MGAEVNNDDFRTLSPLHVPAADELVYEVLREEIVRHDLPPGTALPLRDVARRFEISTTPVREALQRLSAQGLCVQARRRATVVAPLKLSDLEDIQAVRVGIEGEAARIGVQRMSDQAVRTNRNRWNEAVARWKSPGEGSIDEYLDLTAWIRDQCYSATGLPKLLDLVCDYRNLAERYLRIALTDIDDLQGDLSRHEKFLAACEARDSQLASEAARRLLNWTLDTVRPMLTGQQEPGKSERRPDTGRGSAVEPEDTNRIHH